MKPVAYVAGPYRSKEGPNGILKNIMAARDIAIQLWRMGYAVVCPHANTFLMDGAAPDDVWLEGDLEILRRCDMVVMTPNWKESSGATAEKNEAEANNIPVCIWPEVDPPELCAWGKQMEHLIHDS